MLTAVSARGGKSASHKIVDVPGQQGFRVAPPIHSSGRFQRGKENECVEIVSPHSPRLDAESDGRGVVRKLRDIRQAMAPMMTRGDPAYFLNSPEDAWKLNDLVEDIRDALMDYQVCTLKGLALVVSNICPRLLYNEKSTLRVVKGL